MGPNPSVLRKLAGVVAMPSHLRSQDYRKSGDWKNQTIIPLLRRTERKTWGTKAGEILLCAWEHPGADSSGSTVKAHARQRCDLRQPA